MTAAFNIFRQVKFQEKPTQSTQYEPRQEINWWKPKVGTNTVRLLPIEPGRKSFLETTNHNFLKMKKEDGSVQTVSPVCLNFLFAQDEVSKELCALAIKEGRITEDDKKKWEANKGCPLCNIVRKIYRVDSQKANLFSAKSRCFLVIKDRADDNLYVWGCAVTIWRDFAVQARNLIDEGFDPIDASSGCDFTFSRSGEGGRGDDKVEYTGKVFKSHQRTKFGAINGNIPDLNRIWLSGVRDYNTYIDIIKFNPALSKACVEFGLDYNVSVVEPPQQPNVVQKMISNSSMSLGNQSVTEWFTEEEKAPF